MGNVNGNVTIGPSAGKCITPACEVVGHIAGTKTPVSCENAFTVGYVAGQHNNAIGKDSIGKEGVGSMSGY